MHQPSVLAAGSLRVRDSGVQFACVASFCMFTRLLGVYSIPYDYEYVWRYVDLLSIDAFELVCKRSFFSAVCTLTRLRCIFRASLHQQKTSLTCVCLYWTEHSHPYLNKKSILADQESCFQIPSYVHNPFVYGAAGHFKFSTFLSSCHSISSCTPQWAHAMMGSVECTPHVLQT